MAKKATTKKGGDKTITLNIINAKKLVDFIIKFKVIDANALLQIDAETVSINTFTPTMSAIKWGKLDFAEIFTTEEEELENIKIGIYNLDKFVKIFSFIDEDEIALKCVYSEKDVEEDGIYPYEIHIITKSLKKKLKTADKGSFNTLKVNQLEKAFSTDTCSFKLTLTKGMLNKVMNLANLEASKALRLAFKDGELSFIGKEFSLKDIGEVEVMEKEDMDLSFEKEVFKYSDKEDYEVYGKDNAILLFSKESSVNVALALIEDMDDDTSDE